MRPLRQPAAGEAGSGAIGARRVAPAVGSLDIPAGKACRSSCQPSREITAERTAIRCAVVAVIDQAVVISVGGRRISLPRGQVKLGVGVVSLPEWLARDKGLL